MIDPPVWQPEDLERDRSRSIDAFRSERLQEPLEHYVWAFDQYQGNVENLFATTLDLTDLNSRAIEYLTDARLLAAFRYLAGPPISDDDLKTVALAASLNPAALRRDSTLVERLIRVVLTGVDRRRFPWVIENRPPTPAERHAAIIASAAMMAAQRVGTTRRNEGKRLQEGRVVAALLLAGFERVASRAIDTLTDAPDCGQFCGECMLGTRKADFAVRLWDRRIMAIECKVSNSAVNSVKRLNNDAAAKAEAWRKDFGVRHVVPTAVLSEVFKLHNLVDAQSRGLTLFWAHDLKSLTDWIEGTR